MHMAAAVYDHRFGDWRLRHSRLLQVLPEFANVDDFVALLNAAHERDLRVITDR